MGLIVTGTDTGVGKTVVCALLLLRYARQSPWYWKPVATGGAEGSDTRQIARWTGAPVVAESYRFRPAVSPHLAARRARRRIRPAVILREYRMLRGIPVVVEGIGGTLVPLNERGYLFADLAGEIGLPCLVVARSTLGTINHTLLTLESLRSRGVEVAGVVMNGPPNPENLRAIERFVGVDVLAHVPPLARLSGPALRRAATRFDAAGALGPYLAAPPRER